MADDTLELIEPIFENNPLACPKNMLPYEDGVLLPKQQRAVNSLKVPTVRENQQYLAAHPEVNAIVTLLLRAVFAQRPKNIPEFMGNFMARDEVEEEIKAYLQKELHTVIGKGVEEPHRNESKRYHFLDEDEDDEVKAKRNQGGNQQVVPGMPEQSARADGKNGEGQELKTSISDHIQEDEEDGYRMSVISGVSRSDPILSTTIFESGSGFDQTALRTLMAPRVDSSTHTDSLGTCSLLDVMDASDMARSISTERPIVMGDDNEIPFSKSPLDDDVGSAVGDQYNDEMIMRMPKRNLSGLSAISEQGIFKAVEVETVGKDGGGRRREKATGGDSRRSSLDSKRTAGGESKRSDLEAGRGATVIQEEDEAQHQ